MNKNPHLFIKQTQHTSDSPAVISFQTHPPHRINNELAEKFSEYSSTFFLTLWHVRQAVFYHTCICSWSCRRLVRRDSWVFLCPRRSRLARWSDVCARSKPCDPRRDRSRKAYRSCVSVAPCRRTAEGPCGTCACYTPQWLRLYWCRDWCRRSGTSYTCHSGCRPLRHSGSCFPS